MSQENKPQVNLRVDQRKMEVSYANSFQPNANSEELLLDFGMNQSFQAQNKDGKASTEIVFSVDNRIVMNYFTAKKLAIALNQNIAKYEAEFGEIKVNPQDRRVKK